MVDKYDLLAGLKQVNRNAGAQPVAGDLLVYQNYGGEWQLSTAAIPTLDDQAQNGIVDRDLSTLSYVPGTRTLTIAPTGADFDYYIDGDRYTTTGDSIVHSAADGTHWIYYNDGTGTLVEVVNPTHTQTEDLIMDECLVAMIYYDSATPDGHLFDERHGMQMAPWTHRWMHEVVGHAWSFGVDPQNLITDAAGNLDAHAQVGNTAGQTYDEDIEHTINAVVSTTGYEVWWWDTTRWRWETNAGFPFLVGATPLAQYNNRAAGTKVEATTGRYLWVHLFAVGAYDNTPIAFMGLDHYTNKANAEDAVAAELATILGGAPTPEMKAMQSFLLQTSVAYGNSVQSRFVSLNSGEDYLDWRTENVNPSGGLVGDHGSLAGLGDDDHTQYLLLAGRAGNQTAYGGTAASEDLYLRSTANATKGTVFIADDGGDIQGGNNAQFVVEAGAAANTLVVDSNSRVGIGTNAPTTRVEMSVTTADYMTLQSTAVNSTTGFQLINDAQSWLFVVNTSDVFSITDNTAAVTPMIIHTSAENNGVRLGFTASELVTLTSTTRGFVLPSMTQAQRVAIAAPVNGMMVYDTTNNAIYGYEGGAWVNI